MLATTHKQCLVDLTRLGTNNIWFVEGKIAEL